MEVLRNKSQISNARKKLVKSGASVVESPLWFLMRKLGLVQGMAIGDRLKSWDVLLTLNFLGNHVRKSDSILDIGCYASETIVALRKLGYSELTGVDLNPNLKKMPCQNSIRYEIGDFKRTNFKDASFQAITSISVIEHGFDGQSLLKEMSRLLKQGGYFIASFDYWPEKVDTSGIQYFGMDWKIFSKDEVVNFVAEAADYGLFPVGEILPESKKKPIKCGGKQYTFAWLALTKSGRV
ncbi:MAG: class I SAM-dependent methyltransferase [Candidatus Omnitrophota bacterium]